MYEAYDPLVQIGIWAVAGFETSAVGLRRREGETVTSAHVDDIGRELVVIHWIFAFQRACGSVWTCSYQACS